MTTASGELAPAARAAAPLALRARRTSLAAAAAAALFAALGLVAAISWNRSFQVDEVEHIHAAYNLADGRRLYADFWQGHNPLLYTVLRPLVDAERPLATYRRARALMLLFMAGTLAATALAASRLANSALAGALAAGLLLLHSTFVERGIEVRPDGALACCVALALAVGVLRIPAVARAALQGLLLAAAFLFTQKAVFHCAAFGGLWLWQAWRARRIALAAWPIGLWLAPVAATALWLAQQGALSAYLEYNVTNQVRVLVGPELRDQLFGPWRFVASEGARNLFFCATALFALAQSAVWLARRRPEAQPVAFPAALCAVMIAYVWTSPGPYPYLHVGVIPAFALLAAVALALAAARVARLSAPLARVGMLALCLALAAATSVPRLLTQIAPRNDLQLATLQEVQRVTAPDDRVFDLAGLYFRPDAYPVYLMTGLMMARYRAGGWPPITPALEANEAVALIVNYRTGWLPDADVAFLRAHFTQHAGNVYVLGTRLDGFSPGETRRFRALKAKRFRFEGDGELVVDGAPFRAGVLARGEHALATPTGIRSGRLVLDTPAPAGLPSAPAPLFSAFD